MQYKSPFYIINPDITPGQVKLERKKIIAQFEINDNRPVKIRDKTFTKSEALGLLEELENENKLKFHQLIYTTPYLLSFLEDGTLDGDFTTNEKADVLNSPEFIDFVSPYFAAQYSAILFKAFISEDHISIIKLKKFPFLCSDSYYDSCFNKTMYEFTSLCTILNKEVKQAKKNQNPFLIRQDFFERDKLIDTLNALPDYFSSQLDIYMSALLEAVVICYNLKRRDFAIRVIVQAKRLTCSNEVREILNNYYGQIKKQNSEKIAVLERKGNNSGNNGCIYILIAIAIGVLVPIILISIVSKKNEIPKKYKNIYYLDSLISGNYIHVKDSAFCYHKNNFYKHKRDSILYTAKKKTPESDIYRQLVSLSSKDTRTFSSYFTNSMFITSEYKIKNYKTKLRIINNSRYDATFFIVDRNKVLTDIHLAPKDTIYAMLFNGTEYLSKNYDIWLYIGCDLSIVYSFTVSGKTLGYGYRKQPIAYRGIYKSRESFHFSMETEMKDSLMFRKYNNFQFELHPSEDSLILTKTPYILYDTLPVYEKN
jgi:hypothetical protein